MHEGSLLLFIVMSTQYTRRFYYLHIIMIDILNHEPFTTFDILY